MRLACNVATLSLVMVWPMAIIRFRCCVATETLMHVCTAVLLLCSYACRALFFFIIPCNENASGVLLARVTSFAGGYKSSAQNLVLCLRLDQRSVDWHPGHAFHVQQRLFQRERERIVSKMYKTVQAYSLQQCICLLSTILLCLPVIYDH